MGDILPLKDVKEQIVNTQQRQLFFGVSVVVYFMKILNGYLNQL